MTATFLYLTICSLKNRVVRRVRRLREPRYAIGLVVGLVYIYLFFVRNQMRAFGRSSTALGQLDAFSPDLIAGGSLLLWLVVVLVWAWPFYSEAWTFTRPEVQFLFTAPVQRRQLLHYKLLRSQLGVLFGVLVAALFSGAVASGRWSFVLGGWVFFATLQLHIRAASLTKSRLLAPTERVPALAWMGVGVMLVISGILVGAFGAASRAWAGLPPAVIGRHVLEYAKAGVAGVALWPFATVVRPIVTRAPMAFAQAIVPALGLLALNYWWVLLSDARLEEAASAAEKRQATRRGLRAPTARPVPFALAERGRPEIAILWKNTIMLGRYASVATLIRLMIPLVVLALVFGLRSRSQLWSPVVLVVTGFLTVVGPYMFTNDLRRDLQRLPVLKTWPISGRTLLLGEMLAPITTLSVIVWSLLAISLALAPAWRFVPMDLPTRALFAVGAALVAPMLITGQVLVQNAAVILFPGWVTGAVRARGIESMGQGLLMFAGTILAFALGVVPAALIAGGIGFLGYLLIGWLAVLPAAAVMASILVAEAWLAIVALGRLLERTDPSHVEVAE